MAHTRSNFVEEDMDQGLTQDVLSLRAVLGTHSSDSDSEEQCTPIPGSQTMSHGQEVEGKL